MSMMPKFWVGLIGSFGVIAAAADGGTQPASAEPPTVAIAELSSPVSAPPAASGLRAYLDADGRLAPTPPALAPELPAALPQRNYSLMWTEPMQDGSVLLHSEGQLQMAAMARIGADGLIEQYCAPAARPSSAESAASAAAREDAAR